MESGRSGGPQGSTLSKPPVKPPPPVGQGLDLALLWLAADHLNGHELNFAASPHKRREHLRFNLEVFGNQVQAQEHFQVDKPETALGVSQRDAKEYRKAAGHPAIDLSASPRQGRCLMQPVAYDQRCARLSRPMEEGRNIVWSVLTVTVEQQRPRKATLPGALPA